MNINFYMGNNIKNILKGDLIMKTLDYICLVLVVVGAVNWGLIGLFEIDLVRIIFGDMSILSRIVYTLVGLAGLYCLSFFGRIESDI